MHQCLTHHSHHFQHLSAHCSGKKWDLFAGIGERVVFSPEHTHRGCICVCPCVVQTPRPGSRDDGSPLKKNDSQNKQTGLPWWHSG